MRNEVYSVEYAVTHNEGKSVTEEEIRQIKEKADRNWYEKLTQMERDSNLYGCLSLRMKLNLIGLDYCPESEEKKGLSESEYMSIYAKNDLPDATYYSVTADGKPIIHYGIVFPDSCRKNLAIHEHLRWNSYMISKGTIPATKDQILNEEVYDPDDGAMKKTNGKNYKLRRHGNLTTFEGLVEFRKMIAKRDSVSEESRDVIKYDYQLLDDAYWFLKKTGYKIYKIQMD